MDNKTIELNKTTCDKCKGDGKNFAIDSHDFFKRWRTNIGASQVKVALVLRISKEQLSKFENGHLAFGEMRQRKLAEILSNWDADGKPEGI